VLVKTITDRELRAVKAPTKGRIEVSAGDGLVVRVSSTNVRTFGVWWRVPRKLGGPERKGFYSIGPFEPGRLAEARQKAAEVLAIARAGLDPVEELRRRAEAARVEAARTADLTVEKMVARRLEAIRARLRPSTLDQYERTAKVLAASPLATRLLHEVKRGEVREDLRAIGRAHGMGTARKVKTLTRAAAKWAAAEDILPHDVLAGLQFREAEPRERDRVLSDPEILALWQACDDVPPIMAASVRLQLVLALRHPSETTGWRWTDLRRERLGTFGDVLVYSIPAERRKHGIAHALPIPPIAEEILNQLQPQTGGAECVLDGWTLGRELYWWHRTIKPRVVKGTSAAPFTRHDLRRTAASGMTRIGQPVAAADTVLGHVVKGSGRAYLHGARLLEAAGALWAWSAHLAQLVDPAAAPGRVLSFGARA
jgi:integrase